MNQIANWLASGGARGESQRRQQAQQQQEFKNLLAQAQLQGQQLANRQRQQQLTAPKKTYGGVKQGADGNYYQDVMDASGRVIGSVPVGGGGMNPATATASNNGAGGVGAYMGAAQKAWEPDATERELMSHLNAEEQNQLMTASVPERNMLLVRANKLKRDAETANPQMSPELQYRMKRDQAEDQRRTEEAEAAKAQETDFQSETVDLIDRMLVHDGLDAAVGPADSMTPTFLPSTRSFERMHDTLKSRLTKDNLGIMKGVLSDKDIEILTNIGSGELGMDIDQGEYREVLARYRDAINSKMSALPQGWSVEEVR